MENKTQSMETKVTKKNSKNATKHASIRIKLVSKKLAKSLLQEANEKKFGRTIKLDDLFEMAVGLVTPAHLKLLQDQSMTNEDRKEVLRQLYSEKHGPITKDAFTGFMLTSDFQHFLSEESGEIARDILKPMSAVRVG